MAPWICYGQTVIVHGQSVDNPTPNSNGLIGEITSLPYTVPTGKVLVLKDYGMEAYDQTGAVVMFPWIGNGPPTNAQCLMSNASKASSGSPLKADWYIPAGKKVNFRLVNVQLSDWTFGWVAYGTLIDAADVPE